MSWYDFFYYTLLKRGRILIVILGIVLAIMIFISAQKFSVGVSGTVPNSMDRCDKDSDCFEHCGECVSVQSTVICETDESITCKCINKKCAI